MSGLPTQQQKELIEAQQKLEETRRETAAENAKAAQANAKAAQANARVEAHQALKEAQKTDAIIFGKDDETFPAIVSTTTTTSGSSLSTISTFGEAGSELMGGNAVEIDRVVKQYLSIDWKPTLLEACVQAAHQILCNLHHHDRVGTLHLAAMTFVWAASTSETQQRLANLCGSNREIFEFLHWFVGKIKTFTPPDIITISGLIEFVVEKFTPLYFNNLATRDGPVFVLHRDGNLHQRLVKEVDFQQMSVILSDDPEALQLSFFEIVLPHSKSSILFHEA